MRRVLGIALLLTFCFGTNLLAKDDGVRTGIAERMAGEATAAAAAGEIDLRNDLLDQALRIDPECSTAHWAKGEMQVDGQWQSIAEIQSSAAASEKIQQYQTLRESSPQTPEAQLQLARWCRKNDLTDEARFHWLAVLSVDSQNQEALAALDSVWFDGQLVSPDEAKQLREQQREFRKQADRWSAKIAGWERALKKGGDVADVALAELEAEVDETAIPEFTKLFVRQRGVTETEHQRNTTLCNSFVMAMGRLPSYEACQFLVRVAVLADDESVRSLAGEQLQSRPAHQYVPLLIAGLSAKLESRYEVSVSPTGRVQYDHEVFAEGPNGNEIAEVSRTGGVSLVFAEGASEEAVRTATGTAQRRTANHARQYQMEAASKERAIAALNSQRGFMNSRIVAVLQQTTGQDLGAKPQPWWDYWNESNGYESRTDMPYKTYRTNTSQQIDMYVTLRPPCECFAAGTLVWTKTGTQAIETLKPGDLVLTMDERTGELSFRPVFDTTLRAPSPLVHVSAADYQLLTTPGHPFWVEGQGWRMAQELAPGDRILSATGTPVEITAIASSDVEEEAYNLIVEGNNNYFVGPQGLLSHDNTPRRPELVRAEAN